MAHFIIKCMSNNLSTMTLLQRQVHKTTNLFPRYGLAPETIQHMYQCTHKRSCRRWTASVDELWKWIESRNMDPDIAIISAGVLLYISGEINDLPQCPNLTLHSDILRIGCPSIILGLIPKSLARTQQMYFNHIRSKKWD